MSSSSDEFDYGLVNTDEIEIQPFQFEPLPGASNRGRKERSSKRCGSPSRPHPADVVQETESTSSDSEESEDEDINLERIGNTDW